MIALQSESPVNLSATASWREVASSLAPSVHRAGQLSPAEEVVCAYVRQGLSNREIAAALGKSERTVKNQVSAVLAKCGVPTRARLIALLPVLAFFAGKLPRLGISEDQR